LKGEKMRKKPLIVPYIFSVFLLFNGGLMACESGNDGFFEPSLSEKERPYAEKNSRQERPSSLPGFFIVKGIELFRNTISRVDGDRCPSYPTCAMYGEMVIRKHGAIIGILMIVDRLIHETSEGKYAPRI